MARSRARLQRGVAAAEGATTLSASPRDRDDCSADVDPGRDAFALAEEGAAACAARVVGARGGDATDAVSTRMFVTARLMRLRASGIAETVP